MDIKVFSFLTREKKTIHPTDFPMELLEVLLKFENWYKWNTLKIVTEYTKKKNRKNSCFTKLEIGEKNSSHWMDLTQVNYKFQGARYRSGSGTRNRIIPLVRDKLYPNRSWNIAGTNFKQIPALATRNNPTIWSVTGWRREGGDI